MRRSAIALLLALAACDEPQAERHPEVTPRDLPGDELCAALAQVCHLGEPECSEMHWACSQGAVCKACVIAAEIPTFACQLVAVCEDFHVPSLCAPICDG